MTTHGEAQIPRGVVLSIMEDCRAGSEVDAVRVLTTALKQGAVLPNWEPTTRWDTVHESTHTLTVDPESSEARANRVFVAGMVWAALGQAEGRGIIAKVQPIMDGDGYVTGTVELSMVSGNVYHLTPVLVDVP